MVDQTLNNLEGIENPKGSSSLPESLTKIEGKFSESLQKLILENKLTEKEIKDLISYGINMNEKCIQDFVLYGKKYNIKGYMWFARFCSIDMYDEKQLTAEESYNRILLIKRAIEDKIDFEGICGIINIYNHMDASYVHLMHLIEETKENMQEVTDFIFDKWNMLRCLCSFGYVPDGKGNLVPNDELKRKIETIHGLGKILTSEDIEIMHQMVNIGDHKSFWKSLKPREFIETYLKLKDFFISHFSPKYMGYVDPIIKTEGKEFFSEIIDKFEKKDISEAEKSAIDWYVANDGCYRMSRAISKRIKGGKKQHVNGLSEYENRYLENAIDLYNLIGRNEINKPMKLNRIERKGGDRIVNTIKLNDGTSLKTILNNFNQYIDRLDGINAELRNITLHNNQFMSASCGHDYNMFEGLGWNIYLQEGSHAILTNIYSEAGAGNYELEYIIQAGSEIMFQIEINKYKKPQLVGYVKTQ